MPGDAWSRVLPIDREHIRAAIRPAAAADRDAAASRVAASRDAQDAAAEAIETRDALDRFSELLRQDSFQFRGARWTRVVAYGTHTALPSVLSNQSFAAEIAAVWRIAAHVRAHGMESAQALAAAGSTGAVQVAIDEAGTGFVRVSAKGAMRWGKPLELIAELMR